MCAGRVVLCLVSFYGCFYELPLGHEGCVGHLHQLPAARQQSDGEAFLQCGPEGIAVGVHIVSDDGFVAGAVGFQKGHAHDAGPILACRAMVEGADALGGVAA